MFDWVLRFVKGIFIGSGFILPGVSGGALAAVFGVYERIISFLAHIGRDFKNNVLYLIPLGLGGAAGVFLFSFAVSFFLGKYETQILWMFIGCILGTAPSLWKQAGKKGRRGRHIVLLLAAFAASLTFLLFGGKFLAGNTPQNFGTWTLAGGLIGLGAIVPGLSPSNFLIYMGMYKDMADGIKTLDFKVILPVALGAVVTVLLLSKLMDLIFKKAYAGLAHGILGIVLASTVMIVPRGVTYTVGSALLCVALCLAGAALGYWMCNLEKKHKKPAAVKIEAGAQA